MPDYRVYDTDPSKVDNVITFGTFLSLFESINAEFSTRPPLGVRVAMRNSSGIPSTENMILNYVDSGLHFVAEFSNGYPFIQTEASGLNPENQIYLISDPDCSFDVAEEGAGIIQPALDATGSRVMFNLGYTTPINGWILNGRMSGDVSGIAGGGSSPITNCKFIDIQRRFESAIRANVIVDHCSFINCIYIRNSVKITNSAFIATDMNNGDSDGVHPESDYNVYDLPKEMIKYQTPGSGDANSIYGINPAVEYIPDKWGAFDVRPSSFLAGVSSTGGTVGAFVAAIVPKATVVGPLTRGLSFDIELEGYRARSELTDVEVYIDDVLGEAGVAGVLYPCLVTVNSHFLITAVAPNSAVLTAALSGGKVVVRPVD